VIAALAAATLTACGGAPRPEARMASSEGAIRGAQEAGAQTLPQATLQLKLAEEERAQGLALVHDGRNHRAAYMFARAEADADLATALARTASAQQTAAQATAQVQALAGRTTP
jgi:hypothetical protein